MKFSYKIKNINIELSIYRDSKKSSNTIRIFNYHQIGNEFDSRRYTRGTFTQSDFFEQQMLFLKNHFDIINLADAIGMLEENSVSGEFACITVDDGDKSCIEIMNILERHNIPATFFLNSHYLDNKNSFWYIIYNFIKNNDKYNHLITEEIEESVKHLRHRRDSEYYIKYSKKIENLFYDIKDDFNIYLSFEDIKKMNCDLFDIALHGYEHQRFSMMSDAWQKENLLKDIDMLSKYPNYKKIFAIPFGRPGDWNKYTIQVALELGLDIVFADGGVNTGRDVGYKRIPADSRNLEKYI